MKARIYFFSGLILVFSFLTMDIFLNQKILNLKKKQTSSPVFVQQTMVDEMVNKGVDVSTPSLLQFIVDFKYEVLQSMKPQKMGELTENRIQSLARQMEPEHLFYLRQRFDDQNSTEAEKNLAVELLSRNQTTQALKLLKDITLQKNNHLNASKDTDLVYKAQAIDGIAGYLDQNIAISYLNEITRNERAGFLYEHALRAQNLIKIESPAFDQQDLIEIKK